MKILAVADEPSKSLWDYYHPGTFDEIDLIISCGDLSASYLEFLVTMSRCPLLYVRGNHDSRYEKHPPEGCICIEDSIYNYKGLRILGLGGSMRYKPGPFMYTEEEMARRISHLGPKIRFTGGFDILVTHAPARGFGDLNDLPHLGFACFNELLEKQRPMYMLHGHVHQTYSAHFKRAIELPSGTKSINCFEKTVLDIPENKFHPFGSTGSYLYDQYCILKGKKTDSVKV